MAKHKKNITTSTFDDFENYMSGSLSERDQHIFEKKLMEDDFEADALDGFEKINSLEIKTDLSDMNKALRPSPKLIEGFPFIKIAAVIALFISLTVVLFLLTKPDDTTGLSQESTSSVPEIKDNEMDAEQPSLTITNDSVFISQQYQPVEKDGLHRGEKPKAVIPPHVRDYKSPETLSPELSSNDDMEEVLTDASFPKKSEHFIQNIQPVKETELEPIPETGDFNRIASSKVKPSSNPILNEQSGELPTRLKYHESIKDVPQKSKKENLSMTMAGKTFSKSGSDKATFSQAAVPYDNSEQGNFEGSGKEKINADASPGAGYEAYYNYVYNEIQAMNLPDNSLPKSIDVLLRISEKGLASEVIFKSPLSEIYQSRLREIFINGPEWNIPPDRADSTVLLRLEF